MLGSAKLSLLSSEIPYFNQVWKVGQNGSSSSLRGSSSSGISSSGISNSI